MLGILRSAGFTIEDAAHAIWLLDSYVYGHVIQETSLSPREYESTAQDPEPDNGGDYPHLVELLEQARRSEFSVDGEFGYGLERILDALERTGAAAER